MFHVAVYIEPRITAKRGNLWPYSTAKLEARGARCKHVVRRQTSARPRAAAGGTLKTTHSIGKRGTKAQRRAKAVPAGKKHYQQGYDSSQMSQLIGMVALKERRALSAQTAYFKRESSQLADLGKLKRATNKIHSEVPEAFSGIVPADHPFTCVAIFESILRNEFPPLYNFDGVCQKAAPHEEAPAGWSPNSPLRVDPVSAPAPADSNRPVCAECSQ